MARKRTMHYGLMLGLFFLMAELQAGMIDKEGMAPWEICGLCHSLNGISAMSKFPKLAGQKSVYLKSQLLDFRQGQRLNDGGQMAAIVTEIDPLAIDEIVDYFANLPRPLTNLVVESDTDREEYQAGKLLFELGRAGVPGCGSCHNEEHLTAPLLQAQHAAYIRKQLNDFKSGRRANKGAAAMIAIAKNLSEDEISALAIYLHASGHYAADIAH
ncbi:MAG: cytochrome c553 [Pseudohongiellaceae bacterium]|jgi:cytochrome c553